MQAFAVVAVAKEQVELHEVSIPEPGPEDLVVRVTHSWISSGTEGSFIRAEHLNGETPLKEGDPSPFPHVPGYQKVGVVEWVGSAVEGFKIGDRVFASVSGVKDMVSSTGGHISPAVTHKSQVWHLPDNIDPVAFSGLVLTQVGYNCGMRPSLQAGDAAVVLGDGLVGQWAAQTLQDRGARVMLLGRHDNRLALFETKEGDLRVNSRNQDAQAVAREWASEGVQVFVDTVGSVNEINAWMSLMRHDGHLVSAGFNGPHGLIDIQKLRFGELSLHAPSGWTRPRMNATLDLIAQGRLQTLPLISHRFPIKQAQQAYELVLHKRSSIMGVVLEWE